MKEAPYEKLIEAFGGVGYYAVDPRGLAKALTDALASGQPTLINCAIDAKAGTESGHIGNLNPQSSIAPKRTAEEPILPMAGVLKLKVF
jgi:oxalyl-CoA decarboxylase